MSDVVKLLLNNSDFDVEVAGKKIRNSAVLIAKNDKIINKMKWKPKYDDLEFICKTAYEWEKNYEI